MTLCANVEDFESTFNELTEVIKNDKTLAKATPEVVNQCVEVFQYNVPHCSEYRGFSIPIVYCAIMGKNTTKENLKLAYILGWLFQTMQTVLFMVDDYLDNDLVRWGKPTWFALQGKSKYTLVDALNLESLVYRLLKNYFSHLKVYHDLVEYFQASKFEFFLGQRMEELGSFKKDSALANFNINCYKSRTALINLRSLYSFNFHLPMILANTPTDGELWNEIDSFNIQLLHYTMLRNDLHDSFQTYNDMRKVSGDRDIRMGLSKYLAVKAVTICTEEQLKIFKSSYGVDEDKNVEVIKNIYCKLGLPDLVEKEMSQLKAEMEQNILLHKKNKHVFADMFEYFLKMTVSYSDL